MTMKWNVVSSSTHVPPRDVQSSLIPASAHKDVVLWMSRALLPMLSMQRFELVAPIRKKIPVSASLYPKLETEFSKVMYVPPILVSLIREKKAIKDTKWTVLSAVHMMCQKSK